MSAKQARNRRRQNFVEKSGDGETEREGGGGRNFCIIKKLKTAAVSVELSSNKLRGSSDQYCFHNSSITDLFIH